MVNLRQHGIIAVLIKNEKYLLLKDSRNLMLSHWAPPHGRCNLTDRTEEETVIRETKEETNLYVKPIKKLWTTEADTKIKTVSFWLVKVVDGNLILDPNESSEYGWFTLREALQLQLYPETKRFFELILKGKIKPLTPVNTRGKNIF